MLYHELDIVQQYKLDAAFDAGASWLVTGYLLKHQGHAVIVRIELDALSEFRIH
jgi:hypothetical protein